MKERPVVADRYARGGHQGSSPGSYRLFSWLWTRYGGQGTSRRFDFELKD